MIGIKDIFNNEKVYKNEIVNLLGEEYYKIVKYLIYEDYGFDLRDKIGHRYETDNLYNSEEIIYLCILIFCFIKEVGKNKNKGN